jgi:hypothetical protein
MGEYKYSLHAAFYQVPMATALALQAAARERRGQPQIGPDYAERAGDRAVLQHKAANHQPSTMNHQPSHGR